MGDTLTSCARLISAGSGDDVRRLIERLEQDLRAAQVASHVPAHTWPTTSGTGRCVAPAGTPANPSRHRPTKPDSADRIGRARAGRIRTLNWLSPRRRPPIAARSTFSEPVVLVGRADGDAHPDARERSQHDTRTFAVLTEHRGVLGERQPQEVRLRLDDGEADVGDAVEDACAFGDHLVDPGAHLVCAASDADAATCASVFTSNGTRTLRSALITLSCAIAYPTRSAARPYALEKVRSTHTFVVAARGARARRRSSAR